MTKVRAEVVCEQSLYQVAMKHNFSDFLYTGKSEFACHGNKKPAILADSVEAVIAAIYFDGGLYEKKKPLLQKNSYNADGCGNGGSCNDWLWFN